MLGPNLFDKRNDLARVEQEREDSGEKQESPNLRKFRVSAECVHQYSNQRKQQRQIDNHVQVRC